MIFTVLFCLTVALNAIFVPVFLLKSKKIGKIPTKLICSLLFFLGGVFACLSSRPPQAFIIAMLLGFFFSWWGDYFLNLSMFDKNFYYGVASFMLAHFSYIAAFSTLLKSFYSVSFFDTKQIVIFVGAALFSGVFLLIRKYKRDTKLFLIWVYGTVILMMAIKAAFVAIFAYKAGNTCLLPTFLLGGITFIISDLYILVQIYDENTVSAWRLNLATYYLAQTMLATGILFIK